MCGSLVIIGSAEAGSEMEFLSRNRGPDGYSCKQFVQDDISIAMHGWILHLRGKKVIQPMEEEGNLLLFNGEIFGGDFYHQLDGGNDTQFLSSALSTAKSQEEILDIISKIHGPFAFIYWKKSLQKLYYGRDFLGRRSLLKLKSSRSKCLVLASVSEAFDADDEWEEVATRGVYMLDLKDFDHSEISWKQMGKLGVPKINSELPKLEYTSQQSIVNLADFKLTDEYENALKILYKTLYRSLESRILCIPDQTGRENKRARMAILFSGGLDCTVIAGIAHSILPIMEPIDLLNVAFENPRKANSSFEVPDRITGRKSHQELCLKFPQRTWTFIEINVSFTQYMNAKPRITRLMNPCLSVMDLSIAMALWFASSGVGMLNNKEFKTSAKVVFSGLGADELFGGYSRHAAAFANLGWEGLVKEIQMDIDRIATRNLGRDDRIISDNGKEVRFPFLDEDVLIKVSEFPIHLKMNLQYPKGLGDKLLLRLLCHHELKCHGVASEPKRAIQFGSRTAKIESDAKGHVSFNYPPGFEPLKQSEAEDYSRIDDWTRNLLNEPSDPNEVQNDQMNLIDFYSPVQMLSSLFPQMPTEAVEKLLAANGYDLESALSQMYSDDERKKKQVCRHFLSGGCYRKDCWFSHDLDARVCKYWLMGSCNRGDSCQFMHGDQVYDKLTSVSTEKIPPEKNDAPSDVVFNSLEFPTLSQTSDSNEFNFNIPNFGQLVKRTDKKDIKLESKPSLKQPKSSLMVDIPWVSTGDTLASSYFKHRESAIQVALERNKLFQRATECYLSGNKAAAKAYSAQAQSLNIQLQGLHASASVKLFSERNPDWQKTGIVDLHGLHPQEIPSILSMVLSQSHNSTITLITGTGNHSRKSYSSLSPSVESFLNSRGLTWSLASMADKRRGVYLVRLR